MTNPEVNGLRNIVESTLANPNAIGLAVAGCFLEEDPGKALDDLAAAVEAVTDDHLFRVCDHCFRQMLPSPEPFCCESCEREYLRELNRSGR